MKHRLTKAAVIAVTSVAAIVSSAAMASATYFFEPGQPTYFGGPGSGNYCTGGYAIRGTSGMFILTDGHCGPVGTAVYGTDSRFGTIAYTRWTTNDTALISETPGNDAYQIVVDPASGRTPGGHGGKVVGIFPESGLVGGANVGKMGVTSGWTEGTVYATGTYGTLPLYCSYAQARPGDSGGPVWRTNSAGDILAVGITVLEDNNTGGDCFIPIQAILDNWGAWLPTFAPSAARPAAAASPQPAKSAPLEKITYLDPKRFVPLVGSRR